MAAIAPAAHQEFRSHTSPSRRVGKGASLWAVLVLGAPICALAQPAAAPAPNYVVNDSHFHLTNYVQEGTDIHDFLKIMGDKVGRVGAVRDSAAADLVVRQHRRLRPDLLPADRRAALLLLVHRRLHRDGVPLAARRSSRRASIR